ncbi:hypothetical protein J6590_093842 [Homalodisca vitripennis]|nr:hypothetical protein J6590_093842 [Homalodisca vitripennis]
MDDQEPVVDGGSLRGEQRAHGCGQLGLAKYCLGPELLGQHPPHHLGQDVAPRLKCLLKVGDHATEEHSKSERTRAQKIVLRAVGSLIKTLKNKGPRCDLEALSSSRKPIRKVPSKSDYKTSLSKISSHQCVISE